MSTIRVVNLQHTDATEPNIVLLEDGTSVFASGITISGGTNLTVSGTAEFASGTVSAPGVTFIDDNNTGLYSPAADTVAITTAATERIRVDSLGKVGIGETSIDALLVIKGNSDASTTPSIRLKDGSDTREAWISNSAGDLILANGGNDNTPHCLLKMFDGNLMTFGTANTERMRIDSSGNVIVGGTATSSTNAAYISQNGTYVSNRTAGTNDLWNGKLNGTVTSTINADGSAEFGDHSANNGLLINGLGGGNANLTINRATGSNGLFYGQLNGTTTSLISADGAASFAGSITLGSSSSTFNQIFNANSAAALHLSGGGSGSANIDLHGSTHSSDAKTITFDTNSSERMRIHSDGGVSFKQYLEFANQAGNGFAGYIGSAGLIAAGGSGNDLAVRSGQHLIFTTGGSTERMRITSSGNLLKGRTSNYNGAGEMAAFQGNSHGIVIFQSTNVNYTCLMLRNSYANNSGNNVSGNMITFHDNGGTERGKISINGSSTSYIETSDYRLKENVVSLTGAIDRINELKAHRFNFIGVSGDKVDGFLAHEVQAVVPQAVTGTKDEVDEHGKAVMQGIDKSKLIPLLTAALQEAIAKIETLETEVAALKNN